MTPVVLVWRESESAQSTFRCTASARRLQNARFEALPGLSVFVTMNSMAKARSTFAVALLFVWMAAPALHCLVAGEVLTPEEQACCKAMAGQCSESAALHHPCCKKTTPTAQPALASAQAAAAAIHPIAILTSMVVQPQVVQKFAAAWLLDPSPPPRLEQTSPVLRI